jgi:hypothetical protein
MFLDKKVFIVLVILVLAGGLILMKENNSETSPSNNCFKTGCSGQICADENVFSACEFKAEYACYSDARCERQADGECGWIITDELRLCLNQIKLGDEEGFGEVF